MFNSNKISGDEDPVTKPEPDDRSRPALMIAGTYVVFGLLWILLSDRVLVALVQDLHLLTSIQTVKGFAYVVVTGLLVYGLVRRYLRQIYQHTQESGEIRRRFEVLFDHAPDSIMIHNPEGHFLAVNEKTCQRLGYSKQEFLHMTAQDIDSPEFAELVPSRLKMLMEQRELVFESIHVSRDGRAIPVEVSSRLVNLNGQKVILSNCRDISERKASESELKRSEEQFRAIFENAPMAIALVDLQGTCFRCNSNLCRYLNSPPDSVTRTKLSDVIHPHDVSRVDNALRELLEKDRTTISLECRFVRQNQSIVWGQISACVQKDVEGKPEHYIVQILNITERKAQERQLRLTHYMVHKSMDAVYWMDETGRFVYVNDTACRILGYGREDLLRMKVFDIDPKMTRERWVENWEKKKAFGSIRLESEHLRKDGTRFPIEVTSGHVAFEGKSYNCAFVRDITERKRHDAENRELQERLDRARRMESLGILAGGVAHDLNNMLGPLVGYPDLILQNPDVDERTRRHVERMAQSATEAAEVIQDLLTLARRGRYEMEPLDLNDVVGHFIDSPVFSKLTESHPDVRLQVDLGQNLGYMKGSMSHLSKVVMNLIVNACDAMPDGGDLIVETTRKYISKLMTDMPEFEPGNYLVLRISDTGKGIDPADLPKIFEPYYSKKKMGLSGSGLGLSVVYGIVKDHRGYYDVVSEVGKGTSFILYFPITEEAVPPAGIPEKSLGGREKILVVDDSADQRDLASELLASLGYEVEVVTNGHQAVQSLTTQSVDLVVLDMILEPGFDGLDTFKAIRRLHPSQKCVIISGFSATERVDEMQRLGAGGYIRKPYTLDNLNRVIRQTLDAKAPTPQTH